MCWWLLWGARRVLTPNPNTVMRSVWFPLPLQPPPETQTNAAAAGEAAAWGTYAKYAEFNCEYV